MASLSEMSRMCRLCLLGDNKKVKIPIFDDCDIKLFVKISALLPIKISKEDQLPKKICDGCLNKLDVLFEFRRISEDSEKTLLTWLAQVGIKDDDPTISLLAEQPAEPVETSIKEEIEEKIIDLDLAQDPSNDEEAEDETDEEPAAKRPRRSAAIKAQMSIAPESDDDDNGDEPDTVDVASIAKEENENEESDYKEDNVKLENESDQSDEDLSVPGTSAYNQPGPSGLGKSEAEEPTKMNPSDDIVLSLLETSFTQRSELEKRQILESRPTPKITAVFSEKRVGRESSRSFQTSWYDSYKWLCGSSYKQSLYCWPCILLGKAKNSWCSKDGFKDLKNFSRSTKMHEASKEHIKNFMAVVRLEQNRATIQDALRENARLNLILFNENVRKNRLLVSYLIDVTLTLGKQELPFRGHDQSLESLNRGNFEEVFKCLIKRNQELTEHCEKFNNIFTGQSKTIQNKLLFFIHEYLTDFIKNEVNNKECFFFGVMADDITDITERSQCAITIRYVLKGILHERFLGFFDVSENRTADALYNLLEGVLEPYKFRERLVAQCYDGAIVMAGELNGLQAKIKSSAPLALFTHCCAHRFNLVLQQGTKQIDKSRIYFCTLLGIPTYFHNSPKRAFVLDQVIGKRLPRSVETRWYTHSKILNLIAAEWDNLIIVFQTIIDDKTSGSESVNSAKGFLKHFQDFDFAILTKIYYEIFSFTDLLFQILQTKFLNINYCSNQIKIAAQRISELRNEHKFKEFFNWAKNKTELPRKRGKSDNELEIFLSYKILFYEIIDCISLQLSTQFNNLQDLDFLSLVDSSKFTEYVKNFPEKSFQCLLKMYPNVFEIDKLKNELSVLYRDEQFCNQDVQQMIEILYKEFRIIFSETYKLFCLVLTIPATSVSVERNFSCLKRIKTYLRNTMTQERLTGLSTLSIEKGILQSVSENPQFYEDIINKFANLRNCRIDLIYKK